MPHQTVASLLSSLTAQLARHAGDDGELATPMPGVRLFRSTTSLTVRRGVLRPSVCVVAQGEKVAQAGDDTVLRYRAGHFIATSIDMPLAGQVVAASRSKPYLAIAFDLDAHDILSVMRETKVRLETTTPRAAATFIGQCDAPLLEVVLRAANALDDQTDARFLAPLLRRELIYRLARGPSAFAVGQSALVAHADDGTGRAVDWLQAHYKEPLDIAALAKRSNMSTSSLHHKFKATVLMGPLQYQKRLRLEEARRLLLAGSADATSAAFDVGYESPSQFFREYRRHFGLPPLRDLKRMRDELRENVLGA